MSSRRPSEPPVSQYFKAGPPFVPSPADNGRNHPENDTERLSKRQRTPSHNPISNYWVFVCIFTEDSGEEGQEHVVYLVNQAEIPEYIQNCVGAIESEDLYSTPDLGGTEKTITRGEWGFVYLVQWLENDVDPLDHSQYGLSAHVDRVVPLHHWQIPAFSENAEPPTDLAPPGSSCES